MWLAPFQATIGGKFTPVIGLRDKDMEIKTMITTYNAAVTDAASEILWKERRRHKPWVTKDVSTSVIRGRRSGMKHKEQTNTGKQTGVFRRQ